MTNERNNMSEMTKEKVVENLTKGIEKMVDIQWELAALEILDSNVRQTLLEVGEYYVEFLLVVDPLAAVELMARLAAQRSERDLTVN